MRGLKIRLGVVALAIGFLALSWLAPPFSVADSEGEQAIRAEIKDFADARNAGDLNRVLSHVADDANMVSFGGRNQTKTEYGAAVRENVKKFAHLQRTYRVIEMKLPDATHGVALIEQDEYVTEGQGTGNVRTKVVETNRLEWKFESRGGKWLIVRQVWLKK